LASILLSREAKLQLARLAQQYAAAVGAAILSLGADPLAGKALRGRLRGLRSLRVGVYRIIYRFDKKRKEVVVASIRHRSEAYRDAR
jgi:mRNA interferase RelE/StbE